MDLVWKLEYQKANGDISIEVVSVTADGPVDILTARTKDASIVALAATAFAHYFWVQVILENAGSTIATLNILPDLTQLQFPPQAVPNEGAEAVDSMTVLPPGSNGAWPSLEVAFTASGNAIDRSGAGFVEPIVRAGLISGEGVYGVFLSKAGEIERLHVQHSPASARRRGIM